MQIWLIHFECMASTNSYGCRTCVEIAIYILKSQFCPIICTQVYLQNQEWDFPLTAQVWVWISCICNTLCCLLICTQLYLHNQERYFSSTARGPYFQELDQWLFQVHCLLFHNSQAEVFYNVKKQSTVIMSKNSSNNLSNENKLWCFWCLQDKK